MSEPGVANLIDKLLNIYTRGGIPDKEEYLACLEETNRVLSSEANNIRPWDLKNRPGGVVHLHKKLPTLIVGDLHARQDFLLNMLLYPFSTLENIRVIDKLAAGELQIVCVGDAFHAEARAVHRWMAAYEEFKTGYHQHKKMDQEMQESMGLMEMIMELKQACTGHFHFLKGNHENITNENGDGNYPFGKFVNEGLMVAMYVEKFYGRNFIDSFYRLEKNFPLLAIGRNFLVTHAEPVRFFTEDEIINYRDNPDVVYGLTWTDNNAAAKGSVEAMLGHFLPPEVQSEAYLFGGHRPVSGRYNLRSEGRYVQIHNPTDNIITLIPVHRAIDLENDILSIKGNWERVKESIKSRTYG